MLLCRHIRKEVEAGSTFIYNVIALCIPKEHETAFRGIAAGDGQDALKFLVKISAADSEFSIAGWLQALLNLKYGGDDVAPHCQTFQRTA